MAGSWRRTARVGTAAVVSVAVLTGGGYLALRHGPDLLGADLLGSDACQVEVDGEPGEPTTLEPDQARNAALISAMAVRRELPPPQ